jgi:hypothetical protein
MKIITAGNTAYALQKDDSSFAGTLDYPEGFAGNANLFCGEQYMIVNNQQGTWNTYRQHQSERIATCKVGINGTMSLEIRDRSFLFIKPVNWKLRFVLLNDEQEEVAAMLPMINWKDQSYDFILQLNNELLQETDAFIILQALHCGICSMAMLNGIVPPVVVGAF